MCQHNEPFFAGHFQKKPFMPGVIIKEACSGGPFLFYQRKKTKGKMPFLQNSTAKFKDKVVHGDR
jgi:3-hydroxyacyl-[acyl-carrier-protein] dehydratase